jgi:hypothetical protein
MHPINKHLAKKTDFVEGAKPITESTFETSAFPIRAPQRQGAFQA